MTFKEKLNMLKKEKGRVTIQKIAEDTDIPFGTLNKLFSGETQSPTYGTLAKLSFYFDCTIDYLVDDEITDRNYIYTDIDPNIVNSTYGVMLEAFMELPESDQKFIEDLIYSRHQKWQESLKEDGETNG